VPVLAANSIVTSHQPTTRTIVREFDSTDAEAVEKILNLSPEAAAWSVNSLAQLNRRGELGWVVESHGIVSGFIVVRAVVAEAEILNLCVDPAKRRAGNATALLQKALDELSKLRVQRLYLEVRESNLSAISFYRKHGFAETGLRAKYYRDPDEAAVLMMRELTG
jgi:ribosomal-protein-alanine acetyltransferase